MQDLNKLVAEFQEKFGPPTSPDFWADLIHEETEELLNSFVNTMKELADLNYVMAGYINVCEEQGVNGMEGEPGDKLQRALMALDIIEWWLQNGIPLPTTIEIVHKANMSKVDDNGEPVRHPETGKILKEGTNYQPAEPVIAQLLYSKAAHELESMKNAAIEAQNQQEAQ